MYGPKLVENPTDLELANKIIKLINMSKTDECTMSDTYMNAAVLLFQNEKSASSAHALAQSYFKRKDYTNAEKFYNEAINLETEVLKKSDMYYELGLVLFTTNSYQSARTALRSAISNNSSSGKSYIIIGKIYGATAKSCVGESSLEKRAVHCLIVDQFIKAKNADPSNAKIVQEANELIGRYSAGFPTHEDAFWGTTEINEGDPFTVGGWINESTTIRFAK
jgi:tetratricopeptide (TPR) repeat protein